VTARARRHLAAFSEQNFEIIMLSNNVNQRRIKVGAIAAETLGSFEK